VTPEQIVAVQRSFAELSGGAGAQQLAIRFYERLFELDASTRRLFSTDPEIQRAKFLDELTEIVRSISSLDTFVPRALDLGNRHRAYGVMTDHYRLVGVALVGALGDVLGESFTPELQGAWTQAYDLVAETMMEGAAHVEPRPAHD
jgi:hemoglobin-like flavoprotein